VVKILLIAINKWKTLVLVKNLKIFLKKLLNGLKKILKIKTQLSNKKI
jgi:hypothetical protein